MLELGYILKDLCEKYGEKKKERENQPPVYYSLSCSSFHSILIENEEIDKAIKEIRKLIPHKKKHHPDFNKCVEKIRERFVSLW